MGTFYRTCLLFRPVTPKISDRFFFLFSKFRPTPLISSLISIQIYFSTVYTSVINKTLKFPVLLSIFTSPCQIFLFFECLLVSRFCLTYRKFPPQVRLRRTG